MAFTTAQLTALEEAIASGELTVSYEGKTVTYRSMKDLREAYDMIRSSLESAGLLTEEAPKTSYAAFSRD